MVVELVAAASVTLVWTGPIAARGSIFHRDAAREPSPTIRTPTELDQTLAEQTVIKRIVLALAVFVSLDRTKIGIIK
ncbi:hypothetical protein ACFXDH_22225 [Streptomyces sp. NPDC059467]|uniref:hypothetical protein n=1 Tax=Streptomyces sp. NPDC059467 TaxID=3346844 RepID=UPI003690B96C